MKRLFSWLFKPMVLSFIGVALLALVFWFEAPLLAFDGKEPFASRRSRAIVVLLMFAAWGAWFGWRYLQAHLANRRLMASMAAAEAPPAAAGAPAPAALQEQAALKTRMDQALATLRKAAPKGGRWNRQYLYQLPWYMFVGAPGSGKTTALLHSGLRFPLAETLGPGAIGGVGGTRQCDWWFTDEAVLLDTAGRYTTQDSEAEVDQAGWHGFLGLLKKHRPRRPIDGVIVALSVSDLLQQGPAARQAQAAAIRARIKELHERLGSSFPVYVTVTKCDLLAGFMEYFDPFGREERAQVWGLTFPVGSGPADALAQFPARFLELEQQLQAGVMKRLQDERDLQRRALVYRFPQQFGNLGELLEGFLQAVFAPTRFERDAQLRGVYFTSGTQEGSPIDRVMGALANTFGLDRKVLPPNAVSGRSFFLTDLLRELVFKESSLAGSDAAVERRQRLLRRAGAVTAALALVLLAAGLATSYVRNKANVNEMEARSAELEKLVAAAPATGSPLGVLPMLDAARALPGGYDEREAGAPLLERFGLNQSDKLGAGAQLAYQRLLRSALLPRVMARLEETLRRGDANNQEQLYEALRVYLMLGQPLHLDPQSVQAWLEFDWRRSLPEATPEQRDALLAHVGALFDGANGDAGAPPALDTALVAQVRSTLAMMPLPERLYNRLKRQVAQERLPETSVNRAVGRDVSAILARASGEPLTRGVPGLFSVAGHKAIVAGAPQALTDIARDSWVLDRREAEGALGALTSDQLQVAVLRLYYADYIRAWDAYLADVRIAPFSSLDAGARITNALAGADSPLKAFLMVAARETRLGGAAGKTPVTMDAAVLGKLAEARKKLEAALGGDDPAPAQQAANPVDQHFAPLHRLVGTPQAPGTLDAQLALLKDASAYFDAADQARRAGAPAPSGEALQKVKRAAEGMPEPLGGMLRNVDSAGSGLTLGSERARLGALWAANGAAFCRDAIAGRYPMTRGAARDATPDDFGRFFGPGGTMDDFFTKNLAAQVDMAGSQWKWRDTGDGTVGIPQDVLNQFQRAARVREMFFASGGRQPSLRFDLLPVGADPGLTNVVLDIDGQPVTYAAGAAARPVSITLPSGKGGGQVRFEATPALRADLRSDGPWAWFRMLDKGVVQSGAQAERYALAFDLDGRKMNYQLTASSVINPFRREALEGFRCPTGW
ncbi:type VI secretion system membrane subunit TssM [Telluria beijingensis]|uniref:type VI secretion system membrane subunit TssM n=1 Tax=Telluria beijingensis TaxID=3068633 RepID=UPI0027963B53|nr:type VI secretion system membrane subunit TssM [Massilia sp. REN29]